jgi:hypothetical protein
MHFKNNEEFSKIITIFLFFFAGLSYQKFNNLQLFEQLFKIAIIFLLTGHIFPKSMIPFKKSIEFITKLISNLVSYILLFSFYYFIFTPYSLLLKLFRVKLLPIQKEKTGWFPVKQKNFSFSNYLRQF